MFLTQLIESFDALLLKLLEPVHALQHRSRHSQSENIDLGVYILTEVFIMQKNMVEGGLGSVAGR